MVHTKSFEALYLKMLAQASSGRRRGEGPVFQFKDEILTTKSLGKLSFPSLRDEHLLGRKVVEQFIDILRRALGHEKFARRDIQESYA